MSLPSSNLKSDVLENCISQHSSQSTDQVSHGRNQVSPFLDLSVTALTNQVDWWHHELDCVTLSYKRLLEDKPDIACKLLMWRKWDIIYSLFLPRAITGLKLQVLNSSSLHVISAGVGTKCFLLVTSCHGHELSILVEMRTAGRSFFLILLKLYWPFFRL